MEKLAADPSHVRIGPLSHIRPTVNFANHSKAHSGQQWGPRIIPDCQLVYIISGQAILEIGEDILTVHSGQGIFYGEASPHRLTISSNEPAVYSSIHFSWNKESPEPEHPGPQIRDCLVADLQIRPKVYTIDMDEAGERIFPPYFTLPQAESMFVSIANEYKNQEPGHTMMMRGHLIQLLAFILRNQVSARASDADRMKLSPALEAIAAHPFKHWTIPELAGKSGYHPTYFAALFRGVTGMAPKQYLVQERIRIAKEMLLEKASIEEAAKALGFSSIHYFSRHFKAVTGLTPSAYKNQQLEL